MMGQVDRKLYHGTAAAFLPSILADGIKPRANATGTWVDPTSLSHPEMVYLGHATPFMFALSAATAHQHRSYGEIKELKAVVFEVAVDRLDRDKLYPDEDSLSQIIPGAPKSRKLHEAFRDRLPDFKGLWELGMMMTGTLAHRGVIPTSAITRYCVYDGLKNKDLTLFMCGTKIMAEDVQRNAVANAELLGWAFERMLPLSPSLASICKDHSCFDVVTL